MFVCAGVAEQVKILKVLNVIYFFFYVSCSGGDWHVFQGIEK